MTIRNRMTWAAGRKASSPPATPGYGTEDQDHPAHQDDPAYEAYKEGDPDAWAETPKPPPYPEGNPPATPGYDTEDQDHPAHDPMPRVPKEANLRVLVERKAAKCARIAQAMLGPKASLDAIEDQSLGLMDLPDAEIDATLARMGGGFVMAEDGEDLDEEAMLAEMMKEEAAPDEEVMLAEMEEEIAPDEEAMLAEMMKEEADDDEVEAPKVADLMAAIEDMKQEIMSLKRAALRTADQNDPRGKTLAPGHQTEEQVKAEAEATAKDEVPSDQKTANEDPGMAAMFDAYDTDRDGFITASDWKGPRALFASLDTDSDGILARHEVVACGTMAEDGDLDPEEAAMLASMEEELKKAAGEVPPQFKEQQEKNKGDKDEESEKKAAKKAEDEESEDEESEAEEPKKEASKKKGCEPSEMFALYGDPMGLDDAVEPSEEDEAMLAEIFGTKQAAEDEESEGEESEAEEPKKEASKKAKKAEDEESEAEESEEPKKEASKKAEDEESEDEEPEADESEGEEPEADEDEEVKKEARRIAAKKQAALRPQPRKPNAGIKSVGGMTRTAGVRSEVGDLEKLWESAPDVSDVFGK